VGYGLSIVPQNQREDEYEVGHMLRSSALLHVERVGLGFGLKTGGGMVQIVHMASLRRSRGDEAEDGWVDATGCIRLFYPTLPFLLY
jgi:hypothetical protein